MSLLVGRSFETSTVPNLNFPNNDSACERSYCFTTGQGIERHTIADSCRSLQIYALSRPIYIDKPPPKKKKWGGGCTTYTAR